MINAKNIDYKYLMENQKSINKSLKSRNEAKIMEYDFKIVSFKIGGEYYGIDIMKVKEILKAKKFTRIPNALDFVVGVLNLRGEIIPIIDIGKMFHLEENNDSDVKSIIIIKIENLQIGLAVEQINHVIPLRRGDIQPPSPLLGSINERYIEGVVELNDKLFVILDTESIFSDKEKSKREILPQSSDLSEEFFTFFSNQVEEFAGVHINEYNKDIFRELYDEYAKENNVKELPKIDRETASTIIKKVFSQHTGSLWKQPYTDNFLDAVTPKLNKICSEEVRILDVGCGNGHEAYSLFFLISADMKEVDVRMIAADVNLIAVSNATGFEAPGSIIPSWINKEKYFIKLSDSTYKIKKEITDKIYFEFHNAQNIGSYKREFDLVVARDLSLSLSADDYKTFLDNISSKIISGGVLVIGDNEKVSDIKNFTKIQNENITAFVKN